MITLTGDVISANTNANMAVADLELTRMMVPRSARAWQLSASSIPRITTL
jgi:hypothetical protein